MKHFINKYFLFLEVGILFLAVLALGAIGIVCMATGHEELIDALSIPIGFGFLIFWGVFELYAGGLPDDED